MPLNDLRIRSLERRARRYVVSDGNGLALEVFPTGAKAWRYRYSLNNKAEVVSLGKYPVVSLKAARARRDACAVQVANGISPARQKQADRRAVGERSTVRQFGERYLTEVVAKARKDPEAVRQALVRDVYPLIGDRPIRRVTADDCRRVIWHKKGQGFDKAAGEVRGLLKRLFDYAVTLGALPANPVAAIPMRHVCQAKPRERALSPAEVKALLKALRSRAEKEPAAVALELILLTLVRKGELLKARWTDVDLKNGIWTIPAENSKNGKRHVVYLAPLAIDRFKQLLAFAAGSEFVLPSHFGGTTLAHNALNRLVTRLLKTTKDLAAFTVHDLRRTGSTLLHEQGFPADVIEKALNHTIGGVRGVYNRAEYAEQRRDMLARWAVWLDDLAVKGNVISGRFPTAGESGEAVVDSAA